jgi:hypothetical protein
VLEPLVPACHRCHSATVPLAAHRRPSSQLHVFSTQLHDAEQVTGSAAVQRSGRSGLSRCCIPVYNWTRGTIEQRVRGTNGMPAQGCTTGYRSTSRNKNDEYKQAVMPPLAQASRPTSFINNFTARQSSQQLPSFDRARHPGSQLNANVSCLSSALHLSSRTQHSLITTRCPSCLLLVHHLRLKLP